MTDEQKMESALSQFGGITRKAIEEAFNDLVITGRTKPLPRWWYSATRKPKKRKYSVASQELRRERRLRKSIKQLAKKKSLWKFGTSEPILASVVENDYRMSQHLYSLATCLQKVPILPVDLSKETSGLNVNDVIQSGRPPIDLTQNLFPHSKNEKP